MILGGGSNVLIGDGGVTGPVVRVATRGVDADVSGCSGAVVTVAAGENWDALVARAVEEEWGGGIEVLAGIPGQVGATPIQNVGAYGSEVAQLISSVRTWDRVADRQATFAAADCGFGFRTSRFKTEPDRYLILAVTFQLPLGSRSAPIRYAELARTLGVAVGERVPPPPPGRRCSSCGAPRGWCWTMPTSTPGAPDPSSSIRSWTPIGRPALPAERPPLRDGRRPGEDQCGLADRAVRDSARATGVRRRPCRPSTPWP